MEKDTKIRFKDLSGWMKAAAIGGLISLVIYSISFIGGFISGLLGV